MGYFPEPIEFTLFLLPGRSMTGLSDHVIR
jgi:hypothetical protein